MDFLERLFGWSPDGGDGTVELMLVVATVVAVVLGLLFRRTRLLARRKNTR